MAQGTGAQGAGAGDSKSGALKLNPPRGRRPTLQFVLPGELAVDDSYQRSVDNDDSRALIRRIAAQWNWDLCQPLVVARRGRGAGGEPGLFVIDGQHRLLAARLRGDIPQLPAVIVEYASAAEEAANFVSLNQQRRPLNKLDVFRAALASGDELACGINAAIADAGLTVAKHTNGTAWKVGQIGNIGGIEAAWKVHGERAARDALKVLAQAFGGQVLRYAGTIYPGIAALCATWPSESSGDHPGRIANAARVIGGKSQLQWRSAVLTARAVDPSLGMVSAAAKVVREAFGVPLPQPAARPAAPVMANGPALSRPPAPPASGLAGWCEQCEMRVSAAQAGTCRSRFCKMKVAA